MRPGEVKAEIGDIQHINLTFEFSENKSGTRVLMTRVKFLCNVSPAILGGVINAIAAGQPIDIIFISPQATLDLSDTARESR